MIVGDAAHAMVPFFGQGMNCGFEDVRVLFDYISAQPDNLSLALSLYTNDRKVDAHAINDLAMRNYIEMRHEVTSRLYKLRKATEEILYAYAPWLGVRTLYSYISFSNVRYSEVVKRVKRQQEIMDRVGGVLALAAMAGLFLLWGRAMVLASSADNRSTLEMGRQGLDFVRARLRI